MGIGVGFDKSPEARHAVRWAADLATRGGASLQVLAVHAPMAFGSVVAGGTYGTLTVNQALANELQSETEQRSESLPAELAVDKHLFEGDPATLLVERSQGLDLLFLGSRRYGPVKSVLLGSVSSFVSRNAYCPVLVVPRGAGGQASWVGQRLSEPPDPLGGEASGNG
jgi:nucleotide-binding universal stress UspA family protein